MLELFFHVFVPIFIAYMQLFLVLLSTSLWLYSFFLRFLGYARSLAEETEVFCDGALAKRRR